MNEQEKVAAAKERLRSELAGQFMTHRQVMAIISALAGEEGAWFADKINEYADRIKTMPVTYQQDGKGDEAIVHLHYFKGAADAWIIEKDMTWPEAGDYDQSFGQVNLFGGGFREGELGYCSIKEMIEAGMELDLHWEPKTVKECRSK